MSVIQTKNLKGCSTLLTYCVHIMYFCSLIFSDFNSNLGRGRDLKLHDPQKTPQADLRHKEGSKLTTHHGKRIFLPASINGSALATPAQC